MSDIRAVPRQPPRWHPMCSAPAREHSGGRVSNIRNAVAAAAIVVLARTAVSAQTAAATPHSAGWRANIYPTPVGVRTGIETGAELPPGNAGSSEHASIVDGR